MPVSVELKEKLARLNQSLQTAFPSDSFNKRKIRDELKKIGEFHTFEKHSDDKLRKWLQGRTLVGIDGSVNSTRGTPNRMISLFQALAKGTQGEEKWCADIYTPLLAEDEEELAGQAAREARRRGAFLSQLEIQLAKTIIPDWKPRVVMHDGSLLHFYIDNPDEWKDTAETALQHDTLLVGVSEEIATNRLARMVFPQYKQYSDSDLLYGVLEVGEAFEWREWSPIGSEMWRVALRSSQSPQPIVVDGLVLQNQSRYELIRLVYTLTPMQGRGIPFWLDIIDNQVRVTDGLIQAMVEQYIDPELRYRVLSLKKEDRMI
nr:DNA double-strand break repair nuclease NurA [Polycladospora coralii]